MTFYNDSDRQNNGAPYFHHYSNGGFGFDGIGNGYGYYDNNIEDYNQFNLERFSPTYNEEADYNTNAKSYYDYLARFNGYLRYLNDFINMLARRNIVTADSNTVHMERHHDWYNKEDLEELEAFVKLSDDVKNGYKNGIIADDKGLWTKDFTEEIADIWNNIRRIDAKLNDEIALRDKQYQDQQTTNNNLQNQINSLHDELNQRLLPLDKLIANLSSTGAWNGSDLKPNRNLATGNINHYAQDGEHFIATHNVDDYIDNDVYDRRG